MQFDEVVLGRRSIRGYKPDPVPRELIEEIIALAMRSPSSMNTQPWHFYVITGEPLNRIRAGNTERMAAGVPQSREFRTGQAFAGAHRDRQIGVAKQLFAAMGIARDDADRRQDWVMRGFRQFDAPVCVIITYDRVLDGSDDTPFDCGAAATTLVNAAWSRGLGAVINSQGIMQSPVVREHAGIPEDQVIMKSIALGWPDEKFPANAVVSERRSVDEAAVFVGFGERGSEGAASFRDRRTTGLGKKTVVQVDRAGECGQRGGVKQLAAIYQRRGMVFVSASHRTKAGFWIDDGNLDCLDQPTAEELGGAVKAALANSQNDVPTPPPTARFDKPLLQAAGVRSRQTFMNLAKHVSVSFDGREYKVTPYRNLGSKEGFEPLLAIASLAPFPTAALGELVISLLAAAA